MATDAVAATIEEVVVTARRREETLVDVPAAITVLDEDAIRARGITELNQLEKFAPNTVQTNFGQGNTGHAAVFMRGIGLQDHIITTDPAVGIYVDGVYLGRNMGANMDLLNIERVEVVRGPQGTLSGRNTLGGALNIVTRKPVGDGHGRIDLKAGSLGRLNGNFLADAALGEALAVTVAGGLKSRDGVGDALGIANPEARIGEIFQGFGRVALRWRPAEALDILLTSDMARSDQGVTPHAVEVFNPDNGFGLRQADQPADADDTYSLNNELMSTADETRGLSATVDWDFAERLRLRAILSRRSMWFEGGLDNEKVPATLIEFPERGEADQNTVEVQLGGVADWGDWVAGGYAFEEDGFNRSPFVFRPSGLDDGRPAVIPASDFDGLLYLEQQTESRAVFAHANIDRGTRWVLGLGARHTRDEKSAVGSLHYFAAPARRSDQWRETTGDVSLTYRANARLNVFASYARGYQAGGYPPRPFGGAATFVAFDPTFADSYELGVKGALGQALRLDASLFHVRYTDLVVQVNELIEQGFLTLNQNAAASSAAGVELEGTWQASSALRVEFAFGYLDIEISEVDDRVQGIAEGDSPALTPNYTVSLLAALRMDVGKRRTDDAARRLVSARAHVRPAHQHAAEQDAAGERGECEPGLRQRRRRPEPGRVRPQRGQRGLSAGQAGFGPHGARHQQQRPPRGRRALRQALRGALTGGSHGRLGARSGLRRSLSSRSHSTPALRRRCRPAARAPDRPPLQGRPCARVPC